MSEEMLDSIILYTLKVYQKMFIYILFLPNIKYISNLLATNVPRQMLVPIVVADVIATVMLLLG